MNHPDFEAAREMSSTSIVGDAAVVAEGLERLQDKTGADELMINTATHSLDERLTSLKIVASSLQ